MPGVRTAVTGAAPGCIGTAMSFWLRGSGRGGISAPSAPALSLGKTLASTATAKLRKRLQMKVLVLLLGLGIISLYFRWILAAFLVVAVAYCVLAVWRELRIGAAAETARRDAIIARADQQHAWVIDGDPRGTYGEQYSPDAAMQCPASGGWCHCPSDRICNERVVAARGTYGEPDAD
jgi:hypothetical protein